MKLSVLDIAARSEGRTNRETLLESVELAKVAETLGYIRYWIAEHHNTPELACSCPEVMLAYIGANTEKIRLGSGALLLPYYKPYKVAEIFNTLGTLFPGRFDIGIGRGPGGSDKAKLVLSDDFLEQVRKMPLLLMSY